MLPSTLDIMWPMRKQSLILLPLTVKEKIHLQENILFNLDLWVKVTWNVAQCPLHHVTYAPTEFEVTTSKALAGEAFTRKFNIWPLTLTLGQGHTKCCPVLFPSCDLFSYKVWSCYVKRFRRRRIYKKIQYLTFDLDLGVKVTRNVAHYPLHHVPYSATKFEVAMSKGLGGDAFTRKFNIWPLTLTPNLDLGVKVTRNDTQYPLHHVTYSPTKFEVATFYGLGENTFTRNVTDGHTYSRTDGRRTGPALTQNYNF